MYIPNIIREIPDYTQHVMMQVIIKGAEGKQWIDSCWKAKRDAFCQDDFWQETGKPFYERHIEPLDQTDYLLLGGSLGVAILITFVAIKHFEIAVLPIAVGCSTLIVVGAYSLSSQRVHKKIDHIAWDYVDNIRNIAKDMSDQDPQFGEIAQEVAKLQQPKFEHLKDDIKELKQEIDKFRTADESTFDDSKQAFIAYLKGLQQKLAPSREIIN
jgi:hypothetical protein